VRDLRRLGRRAGFTAFSSSPIFCNAAAATC
jgi:hypothetical protein